MLTRPTSSTDRKAGQTGKRDRSGIDKMVRESAFAADRSTGDLGGRARLTRVAINRSLRRA